MSRGPPPPWVLPFAAGVGAATGALLLWRQRSRRRGNKEAVLAEALRRLDVAHRAPGSKRDEAGYCEAVERWALRLRELVGEPASLALRLGARAQHLERNAIPRSSYPEGRDGYLKWRAAVKRRQGQRIEQLLGDLKPALDEECLTKVCSLVAKSLPLRPQTLGGTGDSEMQCIEDAACLVFLEQELKEGFGDDFEDAKMIDIMQKTLKKMSHVAHVEALTLDYAPRHLGCAVEALAEALGCGEAKSGPPELAGVLRQVPVLSSATRELLLQSFEKCQSNGPALGQAWHDLLKQSSDCDEEMKRALGFPVCRPQNVVTVLRLLLDLLPTEASAEPPRFATLLRAVARLSQRFGGLRVRHVEAMRAALGEAVCKVLSPKEPEEEKQLQKAWNAFACAVAAQLVPFMLTTDPVTDFCTAIGTALPTPGAGPCAALLAAQGAGLVEMTLKIAQRSRAQQGGAADSLAAALEQMAAARLQMGQAACMDAHAYCGFLAVAVFDVAAQPSEAAKPWRRLCTQVPLEVADCAVNTYTKAWSLEQEVRQGAPSAVGDLQAGFSLLRMAAEVSLNLADINVAAASRSGDAMAEFGASARQLRTALTGLRPPTRG